jgi:hypothetical protein
VSAARRGVRATPEFFHAPEGRLPAERGADGRPTRADFEALELLRAVEVFATELDDLPELLPGQRDYRVLIGAGYLVTAFTIVGQPAADSAVELVDVEIDLAPPLPDVD